MQGGHNDYGRDLYFYKHDWDIRDELADIDTDDCSVYLLTGKYDVSAGPEDTRTVADWIEGGA